jgi:mycothiol synthase
MSAAGLVIRNYRSGDFNGYVQLHVETEQWNPSGRRILARTLAEDLGRPNYFPEKDLFVATLDGKIIGYISVFLEHGIGRALLDCMVDPLHRKQGTATGLFKHALLHAAKSGAKVAQVRISETNAVAESLLSRLDFRYIRRFLELKLDIYNIQLPDVKAGELVIRGLEGGQEDRLTLIQNRAFAGTWGFNPNTTAEILYRLNRSGCSPQDVVMAYWGGRPVGYCWTRIIPAIDTANGSGQGQIHMLGVDPDYRRNGIGKIVLLAGLSYLKHRGVDTVQLTVDGENRPARLLYEAAGFKVRSTTRWYEKALKYSNSRTGSQRGKV